MHPLDLVKVKFQVATTAGASPPARSWGGLVGRTFVEIWGAMRDVTKGEAGIRGLYRGLTPNLVGNASSWGLYFLW